MAEFIVNSWEGAIMHMKLTKDRRPLDVCRKLINAGIKSRNISEAIGDSK